MVSTLDPDILEEIARLQKRIRFYPPPNPAAEREQAQSADDKDDAPYVTEHGLGIEHICMPGEDVETLRRRRDEWLAWYQPRGPGEMALFDQALAATVDSERLRRTRAALQAEKVRPAQMQWRFARQDRTLVELRMLETKPYDALLQLESTGDGMNELIAIWKRLESQLAEEGTLYGEDRRWLIKLLGVVPTPERISTSEEAYMASLHCVNAEPVPAPASISFVLSDQMVPSWMRHKKATLWPLDQETSRQWLKERISRELAELRKSKENIWELYDGPTYEAAESLALARFSKDEAQLLRELHSRERAAQEGIARLEKLRARRESTSKTPGRKNATSRCG